MAAQVNVILARDVPNLGRIGDVATVRAGYARNFLVPQGLALPASAKRVRELDHKRRVIEHNRRELKMKSEERAKKIAQVQVTLTAKVGDQGKLFGSIGPRDIGKALAEAGHKIDHRDIKLGGPIKSVGLHVVDVRLEADVNAQFKVIIVPEKIEEPEIEEAEVEAADERPPHDPDAEEDAIQAAAPSEGDAAPETAADES